MSEPASQVLIWATTSSSRAWMPRSNLGRALARATNLTDQRVPMVTPSSVCSDAASGASHVPDHVQLICGVGTGIGLLRQNFEHGDIAQATLLGFRQRGLGVFAGGFQPVYAGLRPLDLELAVVAGGEVDFVLLVAITGRARHDLDLEAGGWLAVDEQLEARGFAGEQIVRVGHRHQLDALAGGLERGRARLADGSEGLDAAEALVGVDLGG